MPVKLILFMLTTVVTALAGGVFFAWSCSVTPGLKLLDDKDYFTAFRAMNAAIQNPVFFSCFFGAALLLPCSAWAAYAPGFPRVFLLLTTAAASYLLGVLAVTIAGNIPINNTIDSLNLAVPAGRLHTQRLAIEISWNRLNTIRTIAAAISTTLSLLACVWSRNSTILH